MAAITAQAVKELRDLTDLPMMDCKKALTDADGDQTRAIELLKERSKKFSIKRQENATSEGLIRVATSEDGSMGGMIEINASRHPLPRRTNSCSWPTNW